MRLLHRFEENSNAASSERYNLVKEETKKVVRDGKTKLCKKV